MNHSNSRAGIPQTAQAIAVERLFLICARGGVYCYQGRSERSALDRTGSNRISCEIASGKSKENQFDRPPAAKVKAINGRPYGEA